MPPRRRRPDPAEVAAVLERQRASLTSWVTSVPTSSYDEGSGIAGESVGELVSRVRGGSGDEMSVLREVVVAADALGRAVPVVGEPPIERDPLRLVVRDLLDALAERWPGKSVEVRVPPFAAVQCVEGPRHTRGTPPNVVETDALTWIRLATGRETWAEAVRSGRVRASGERADLSAVLPVV